MNAVNLFLVMQCSIKIVSQKSAMVQISSKGLLCLMIELRRFILSVMIAVFEVLGSNS